MAEIRRREPATAPSFHAKHADGQAVSFYARTHLKELFPPNFSEDSPEAHLLPEVTASHRVLKNAADTIGDLPDLRRLIPQTFQASAEVLDVIGAGFFECHKDQIQCLWWWENNQLWNARELPVKAGFQETLDWMADGFLVTEDHLGQNPFEVGNIIFLDHRKATATPVLHKFALSKGWEIELNVPVAARGKRRGTLVLFRKGGHPFMEEDVTLAKLLSQQLALIYEMASAADRELTHAVGKALVEERASAAIARNKRLETAKRALQRCTDAISSIEDLDDFVPAVLEIAGDTFGAESCGFFEHRRETVFLRYYWNHGKVYNPLELNFPEPGVHPLIKFMAGGFTVPISYLGTKVTDRHHASIIDHCKGSSIPLFDEFVQDIGFSMELHVPIVSGGNAIGALCIYRKPGETFDHDDIELAESLTAQLALAMQAQCLSSAAKARAIEATAAAAREQSAMDYSRELAVANLALRNAVGGLTDINTVDSFLEGLLSESIKAAGARTGAVCLCTSEGILHRVLNDGTHFLSTEEKISQGIHLLPWNDGLRDFAERLLHSDENISLDPSADFIGKFREFHEIQNNRTIFFVPMRSGNRLSGWVGLGYPVAGVLTTDRLGLLRVIGDQMTMAVEMIRLSEEAHQSSINKERERAATEKANELASANAAMQRAIDGLTRIEDLRGFLSEMLLETMRAAGAHGGAVCLLTTEGVEHHVLAGPYGIMDMEEQLARDLFLVRWNPGLVTFAENLKQCDREFRVDPESDLVGQYREYHREAGNKSVFLVPMKVGERLIGWTGLGFSEANLEPDNRLNLLRALSDQMTMAVELVRLAEESRAMALIQEQSRLAEARALQTTKANEVLSRSLATLDSSEKLDSFLEVVVKEALASSGAVSGSIFLHDPEQNHLRLAFQILRGKYVGAMDPLSQPFSEPIPTTRSPIWEILSNSEIFWLDYWNPDPRDLPQSKNFHDAMGHRFVAAIPMVGVDRAIGFLGLAWDKSVSVKPTEDHLELCRVLAQQASLAVRLTQLAREARETAVAQEREKAARMQAEELEQANDALQSVVDAISRLEKLENFLPEVLRIVGGAFFSTTCAFFLQNEGRTRLEFVLTDAGMHGRNDMPERFAGLANIDAEDVPSCGVEPTGGPLQVEIIDHSAPGEPGVLPSLLKEVGCRYGMKIPLLASGKRLGFLAVLRPESHPFTQRDSSLAAALGKLVALALQVADIAGKENQAVLAEEQARAANERANELAQANAALSRSVSSLNAADDLTGFLEAILQEAITASGAVTASIFLLDRPTQTLHQKALILRGLPTDLSDPENKDFIDPVPCADTGFWDRIKTGGGCLWKDYRKGIPTHWNAAKVFHERHRHGLAGVVPMLYGESAIGFLGLAWDKEVMVAPRDVSMELCSVLAQQAALAVQLTKLAQEARQTAILRLRTMAAQDRARELSRINTILRNSIAKLPDQTDATAFIEHLLMESASLSGAVTCMLVSFSEKKKLLQLQSCVHSGLVVDPSKDSRFTLWTGHLPMNGTCFEKMGEGLKKDFVWDVPIDNDSQQGSVLTDFHSSLGHRRVRLFPLVIGTKCTSVIALCFDGERHPREEAIEIVRALTQQIALAKEMERLSKKAQTSAVVEERIRMAREIHDNLAQGFTGIILQLGAACRNLKESDSGESAQHIQKAMDLARLSLEEARASVRALRPPSLQDRSLATALRTLLLQVTADTGMEPVYSEEGTPFPLPPEWEEHLLRITQEAANNAVRHANADNFHCHLIYKDRFFCLILKDDGCGFVSETRSHGFGLVGIRERTELMAGSCQIISHPGSGTTINISLPRK